MTTNNTESLDARSVFYCPDWSQFIWNLNHTTSLKTIVAVTTIACPVTILLNLLVIIAVKSRRELKKISNILLSRLAVTDLLVGAVSMPLTITIDALIMQRNLFEDTICTINSVSLFVMYTLYKVSFLHLLLIAWERYVAVVKWMKYKVVVTRNRLTKYTIVAWLLATVIDISMIVIENAGVHFKLTLIMASISTTVWIGCFILLAYFYIKAYLGVRKWNRTQIDTLPVNVLVRAKLETKIAYTAFWLTLFDGIFGAPSIVVPSIYTFGKVSPFLHEGSIFRWAETILQLNSLFNPLLYFYRNRQLRKAALELLRCRKPQRIQQGARTVRQNRQRRYSVASVDVEQLQIGQKRLRLKRSKSCGAVTCLDSARQMRQWNWRKDAYQFHPKWKTINLTKSL